MRPIDEWEGLPEHRHRHLELILKKDDGDISLDERDELTRLNAGNRIEEEVLATFNPFGPGHISL